MARAMWGNVAQMCSNAALPMPTPPPAIFSKTSPGKAGPCRARVLARNGPTEEEAACAASLGEWGERAHGSGRRVLLAAGAAAALALAPLATPGTALADVGVVEELAPAAPATPPSPSPSELESFDNVEDQYTLLVPKSWARGTGNLGPRRLVAFHPATTTETNVSILLTPLGADFTSLGSFGTADSFAEALVNGLDRSYLRKPGQRAELLAAKSANGMYYVEYTIQKPGEAKVHLLSAVAVHFNGIYNLLYTLTAQYMEDDAATYESTIRRVVNSFKLNK